MFQPFGIANIIQREERGGREEEKTCFWPATLLTDKRKGVAQKKRIPKYRRCLRGIFIIGLYLCYHDLLPKKNERTRGREARKRRIRVERTCDATMRCFQYIYPRMSVSYLPSPFLSAFQPYWQSIILIKVCGKSSQKDRTGASVHGPRINVVTWTRTHLLLRARACVCVRVRVRPIRAG